MKRMITALVTIVLLVLIARQIDRDALAEAFARTHWPMFAVAVLVFIPQIAAIAWRWQRLVAAFAPISLGESVRLVLASYTMNLILPSKMGDLSKGVFLAATGTLDLPRSMGVVVFEKMLDVATLAAYMLLGVALLFATGGAAATTDQLGYAVVALGVGLAAVGGVAALYFIPPDAVPGFRLLLDYLGRKAKLRKIHALFATSHEIISLLQARGARRGRVVAQSFLVWSLHLVQIYLFFRCLGVDVPAIQFLSLVPLVIFVGLLPVALGGFGLREGAFILFFPQYPQTTMFAVAMYVNLRYLGTSLAGIPYFNHYLSYARNAKQSRETKSGAEPEGSAPQKPAIADKP